MFVVLLLFNDGAETGELVITWDYCGVTVWYLLVFSDAAEAGEVIIGTILHLIVLLNISGSYLL
jgi:hypothetical protein